MQKGLIMDDKKQIAIKGIDLCNRIRSGVSELCGIMDITDDTFNELDRVEDYKGIIRKVDLWKKQYENYLEENCSNEKK